MLFVRVHASPGDGSPAQGDTDEDKQVRREILGYFNGTSQQERGQGVQQAANPVAALEDEQYDDVVPADVANALPMTTTSNSMAGGYEKESTSMLHTMCLQQSVPFIHHLGSPSVRH